MQVPALRLYITISFSPDTRLDEKGSLLTSGQYTFQCFGNALAKCSQEIFSIRCTVLIHLISAFILSSCGSLDSATTTVRDYKLFLNTRDRDLVNQFHVLVDDFNDSVGYKSLSISPDNGNSPLELVTGLELRTGKLGFGGEGVKTERSGLQISRHHFMEIELDTEYVRSRTPSWPGSNAYDQLRLLFFHEVGHGFGLPHVQETRHVMYSKVNATDKDYGYFFSKIRNIIKD